MSNIIQILKKLEANQEVLLTRIERLESQVEILSNDLYYLREMLHDDGR